MDLERAKAAEELLLAEREYMQAQTAVREGGRASHTVYADAIARLRRAEQNALAPTGSARVVVSGLARLVRFAPGEAARQGRILRRRPWS
jgi:hypothetical protein